MGKVKYISQKNKVWEFNGEDWFCNGREIPYATFYEQNGDKNKLREIKLGRMKRNALLSGGDDPRGLCPKGYIYFSWVKDGQLRIDRTKTLTRITDDN